MGLFAELQRRNVIRMAGLYIVGAWLVVQVADTLLPAFDTPAWVMRALVILLAIGFVPTLVFSWVFELTPEGLKRDGEVPPEQSIGGQTARRLDQLTLAGVFLAIALIAADRFWPRDAAAPVGSDTAIAPMDVGTSGAATAPSADSESLSASADQAIVPGIAVMPFDNLSPDPDNQFFAGGMYEEVLTKLSKVPQLRVISRTSMEQIAKQHLEVPAIGRALGVSHVLEGSVRRAGDKVRVTVQLIEAATDNHVWADNYDRQLDDVFAIQSEIALAIAAQLKINLSAQLQSSLGERPTSSQAAYDLYLRAIEEYRIWNFTTSFRKVIALLEPAIKADPDFIEARMLLASAYGRMYWSGEDVDGSYVEKARSMVAEMEHRWPGRAETRLARAQLLYNVDRNYEAALQAFRAVQKALPGSPEVAWGISNSLKRLQRAPEFLDATRHALQLDPERPASQMEYIRALDANGLYKQALDFAEKSSHKAPDDWLLALAVAQFKLRLQGDVEAMLSFGRQFQTVFGIYPPRSLIAARFMTGDVDGALALLAPIKNANPLINADFASQGAQLLKLAGRDVEAKSMAEHALGTIRSSIEEGRPAPSGWVAATYVLAAACAAQAGKKDDAMAWMQKAEDTLVTSPEEQRDINGYTANLHTALGDPESAWLSTRKNVDAGWLEKDTLLALKPYFDRLYGDSPSYQAYMATIAHKP